MTNRNPAAYEMGIGFSTGIFLEKLLGAEGVGENWALILSCTSSGPELVPPEHPWEPWGHLGDIVVTSALCMQELPVQTQPLRPEKCTCSEWLLPNPTISETLYGL